MGDGIDTKPSSAFPPARHSAPMTSPPGPAITYHRAGLLLFKSLLPPSILTVHINSRSPELRHMGRGEGQQGWEGEGWGVKGSPGARGGSTTDPIGQEGTLEGAFYSCSREVPSGMAQG